MALISSRAAKIWSNLGRAKEVLRCRQISPDWLQISLAYVGLREPVLPMTIRLRNGKNLRVETFIELVTFWIIFCREEYPLQFDEKLIIDAGANIGLFSFYAAEHCPSARVVAVEPYPPTFDRLSSMVQTNQLEQRVRCLPVGLGGCRGRSVMEADPAKGQFPHVVSAGHPGKSVDVDIVPLEDLFESEGLGEIDLLKMDIEGSEYATILSASPRTLNRIRKIALEYHPGSISRQSIFDHLATAGFQCIYHRPDENGCGVAHFEHTASTPLNKATTAS